MQGLRYYSAELPYLSVNPSISYVFDWNNVMPGAAYLLAQAQGFKNSPYNYQVSPESWLRLLGRYSPACPGPGL